MSKVIRMQDTCYVSSSALSNVNSHVVSANHRPRLLVGQEVENEFDVKALPTI